MYLIMSKPLSPLLALLLVPIVFGCLGGFATRLGAMMYDGVKMLAPAGIMLTFPLLLHDDRCGAFQSFDQGAAAPGER